MNIDFIKWRVSYADGFELITDDILDFEIAIPLKNNFLQSWCNHFRTDIWKQIYDPLLSQRAIEGINKAHLNNNKIPVIIIDATDVEVRYYLSDRNDWQKCLDNFKSIDDAKTAALKYIYEQEKK